MRKSVFIRGDANWGSSMEIPGHVSRALSGMQANLTYKYTPRRRRESVENQRKME